MATCDFGRKPSFHRIVATMIHSSHPERTAETMLLVESIAVEFQ